MIPYACPHCQAVVGSLIEFDGQVWLSCGGLLIDQGRHFCGTCGCLVYFQRPKKTMAEIVALYRERFEVEMMARALEAVT